MPQTKQHQFTAAAQREGKSVLLVLTGYIWPESDNASAMIAQQLAQLQEGDQLTVLIRNLYGGDTDEGLSIYHDLVAYKPRVKVDGVVASMGVPIMLAGTDIEVSSHSKGMMHRPIGGCSGDFEDMRQRADRNEQVYNELADIMAARTGMTADEVKAMLMPKGKDVWMSPAKMVELKLADRVVKGSLLRSTVAMKELKAAKRPEDILGKFEACLEEDEVPNEKQLDTMNKELLKALGLPDTATQEQYDAAVAERIRKGDSAVAELDQIRKDQAAAQETELASLLDKAVASNRLAKPKADALRDKAKGNVAVVLETVKELVDGLSAHQSATGQLRTGADTAAARKAAERESWDYKRWANEDPVGLAEMKASDRAAFDALKDAHVKALRTVK